MSVTIAALPGIGPGRVRKLSAAGFSSVEDVAAATAVDLATRSGIPESIARVVVEHARSLLGHPPPASEPQASAAADVASGLAPSGVLPFPSADDRDKAVGDHDHAVDDGGRGDVPSARGLSAARRIEHTLGLVRQARRHARQHRDHAAVAKTRRQMRKLREALADVQRQVLGEGLSPRGEAHLISALAGAEDTLAGFVDAPPRRRSMRAIRKQARTLRRAITG